LDLAVELAAHVLDGLAHPGEQGLEPVEERLDRHGTTFRTRTEDAVQPNRARRGRRRQSPENQILISRSADSGESEPCTRFSCTAPPQSRARSPRIDPGSAFVGSVVPI